MMLVRLAQKETARVGLTVSGASLAEQQDIHIMPDFDQKVKDLSRPHLYLATQAWRQKRRAVLKRDGYRCRVCGASYHWHILDVHNRTRTYLEDALLDDLITMCRDHHRAFHEHRELSR